MPEHFLADGTPLLLTLFKKAKLAAILSDDGMTYAGPANEYEDLVLLFFAAHSRQVWTAPGLDAEGKMKPLYGRPDDFEAAVDYWSTGPACAAAM